MMTSGDEAMGKGDTLPIFISKKELGAFMRGSAAEVKVWSSVLVLTFTMEK